MSTSAEIDKVVDEYRQLDHEERQLTKDVKSLEPGSLDASPQVGVFHNHMESVRTEQTVADKFDQDFRRYSSASEELIRAKTKLDELQRKETAQPTLNERIEYLVYVFDKYQAASR